MPLIIFLPPLLPRMLDHRPRRVVLLPKPAAKSCTNGLLPAWSQNHAWTMMPINTILQITVLAIQTRIEASQIGDGFEVFLCGLILVLETAFVTFGAGAAEVMVVAEFVICGAAFDFLEDGSVDGY